MYKYIICFVLIIMSFSYSIGWTYPLKLVSMPTASCKFSSWNTLGESCKIKLPILIPSNYKKYINNLTYRRIYTVLWGASYKYGWDQGYGSHLGVDIATSLGTPVYSIGPGKVIFVGEKNGWGRTIIIQHNINGKYIYSNYCHLNKIYVKSGQYVKEGEKIGEVGHSGFSIGNHLHFQIDTNPGLSTHPFWYKICAKNKSIIDIVNNNFCFKELSKNTIDPLSFLASNGAIIKNQDQKTIIKEIPRDNMISYEEIKKQLVKDFLKTYKFSFNFKNLGVYYLGKYGYFTISLKDKKGKKYSDILPDDLKIIYDKSFFSSFYPRNLKILDKERKITFLPKKTGTTFITIKIGDFVVYQKSIRIIKPNQKIQPYKGDIIIYPKKLYVFYPAWGINLFKDKNYINIINTPFYGEYYLQATSKDIVFCKTIPDIKYLNYYQCNSNNTYNKLKFNYNDTILGLFIFKFFSKTGAPTQIFIKDSKGKIISKSPYIYFNQIKFISNNSLYINDTKIACKYGLCLNLINKGNIFIDKKLSKYLEKKLLANLLLLFNKKVNFNTSISEKTQFITRKEFISNIIKLLGIKIKDYGIKPKYIDVKNFSKEFINIVNYLDKLGFRWKDKFSKYYFQPNKDITIGEALYFALFMINKLKG